MLPVQPRGAAANAGANGKNSNGHHLITSSDGAAREKVYCAERNTANTVLGMQSPPGFKPQKVAARRTRGRPRDEVARQRILKAALESMEETTFAQVTAEAIAEGAGAGQAVVYRWLPNKAAEVVEAFREAVTPELPDTASQRSGCGGRLSLHLERPCGPVVGVHGGSVSK
jgi:hypothetical protein